MAGATRTQTIALCPTAQPPEQKEGVFQWQGRLKALPSERHSLYSDASFTRSIKVETHLQDASEVIKEIVETEAWTALGYQHSVEWWDREVGVRRMHPAIREAVVAALRRPHPRTGRQLSQREIAQRVDAGVGTVNRDMQRQSVAFRSSPNPNVVSANSGNRWSRDERSKRAEVRRGGTVLANEDEHPNLMNWAQTEDGQLTVHINGRGRWANPFEAPGDGDPGTVAEYYRQHYLPFKPSLIGSLDELRGKILVCNCHDGEPCHGEILVKALEGQGIKLPRARRRA